MCELNCPLEVVPAGEPPFPFFFHVFSSWDTSRQGAGLSFAVPYTDDTLY